MIYEKWTFHEKMKFLSGWKEMLKENDDEKLRMILIGLTDSHTVYCEPACAETANALLTHFELIPELRARLMKGSDLSETTFSAVLRGDLNDRS